MNNLILRELTIDDEVAFLNGFEDWKNEDIAWYSFVWKPGMPFSDHLTLLSDQKEQNKIPTNKVPSSMLYAFVNTEIVGRLSIRHELNDGLMERGGHLGYAVSPRHRQKGYATEIFKQGLKYCQGLGLQKVLVTCGDHNTGSWKIIEKFAAHLENRTTDTTNNEVVRRYWVDVPTSLNGTFKIHQKVLAYITRRNGQETEILVFDHDQQFSDAGTQVPSGSVEQSENLKTAVIREVFEESGLNQIFEIKKIDEYLFFADWSNKYLKRHVFHLEASEPLLDKWTHIVSGHGDDKKMNFHFYWLNLKDALGHLSARFDDSIFKVNPSRKQISIGVAQTANSLDVAKNFNSIKHFLNKFKNEGVDLIVFPECSLSGFSAKMKECTSEFLEKYLLDIQEWSNKNKIEIILPTAIVEDGKVYNSGFLFKQNKRQQFFKMGLTDSEKQFFSIPERATAKVLAAQSFKYGLLICKEAQQDAWAYIDENVDFIIWPGYWGWTKDFTWQEHDDNKDNLVFLNSAKWKRPIVQSNFACNDLGQHTGSGPEGLSIVVDSDNKVVFQASHLKESGYIVNLEKINNRVSVAGCRHLDEKMRSL